MRTATLRALGVDSVDRVTTGAKQVQAHAGLYFDRCAPIEYRGDALGSITPDARDSFLKKVATIGEPAFYRLAYERWWEVLRATKAWTREVVCRGRLLVGHGNPSLIETGIGLHPTYGVPYVPGPALKGLLNHYTATLGVDQEGEGSEWRGVKYDEKGRPRESPGLYHGCIFGAPEIMADDGAKGAVVFEDAWYIPGSAANGEPLARDVLTSHQSEYYRHGPSGKGSGPNDWEAPIPVSFLSVRPGARFLIAISPLAGEEKVAPLALRHLLDALDSWGVGAKTRAGYGRLVPRDAEDIVQAGAVPKRSLAVSSVALGKPLDEIRAAVERILQPRDAKNAPPVVQRFQAERERLHGLISSLTQRDVAGAIAALERLTRHQGLMKHCEANIQDLRLSLVSVPRRG